MLSTLEISINVECVFFDFADEPLKCYMCTSLTNPGCDTDPKAHNIEPVECTLTHMADWQGTVNQNNDLKAISHIFEVDNFQHSQSPGPMACAKMVLKGNLAIQSLNN